jgi:hypothetical protein
MRITFVDRGSSNLPLDAHHAVGDRRPAGSRAFSPPFAASSETCGHGRSPLNRRVIAATSAELNCGLFGPLPPIRTCAETSHSLDEAVRGRTL